MVWIKEVYLARITLLLAGLAALIPWTVTIGRIADASPIIILRFPFAYIRHISGHSSLDPMLITSPVGALRLEGGRIARSGILPTIVVDPGVNVDLVYVYVLWIAGSCLLAVAVVIAILFWTEYLPHDTHSVDFPRVVGALLAVTGLVFAVTSWGVWNYHPGITIPLGPIFLLVFGWMLISADRI